ncbi:acetyltransferase [Ramlibacter sp. MAHUQ-53]|uniref:acetyltransferase n=1 Tax=unclassified Ramlibacter TaxID=2617605 RepID=UPI003631D923
MPSLLILGAGGHARVVADAALRQAAWPGVAASDRDPARAGGELLPGVPLVAREPALASAGPGGPVHVAIGDNAARRREGEAAGLARLASVVHPQASVSPHAEIGPGCFVAAQAVVAPLARLAAGVIVNHGAVVDHDVRVGAFTHIAPGASLAGAVTVGEGVLVGAGARLLPGVAVCDGATVGAGAVVTQDITEAGTWVGVPARRIP